MQRCARELRVICVAALDEHVNTIFVVAVVKLFKCFEAFDRKTGADFQLQETTSLVSTWPMACVQKCSKIFGARSVYYFACALAEVRQNSGD